MRSNPFSELFYGLIDSKIHWLFNHGSHITIVISAANDLVNIQNDEIFAIINSELEDYFTIFNRDIVVDYKIIKEKRATFIPTFDLEKKRRNISSPYKNLILAGDWTNTGLPSTIESAVKSGKSAANEIKLLISNK